MHLEAMAVRARDEARVIEFHVNMLTPSALEQIKFVNLVETRFGAEQGEIGRFWRAPDKPFGLVAIRFPNAETFKNAKSFCADTLTRSGMMKPGERGALDQKEDAEGKADLLFRRLQAQPFRDLARSDGWAA